MSKWYMVKVTIVRDLLVEVKADENEQLEAAEAMSVAMDNTLGEDDIEAEVRAGPFLAGSSELKDAKRHADEVLPL